MLRKNDDPFSSILTGIDSESRVTDSVCKSSSTDSSSNCSSNSSSTPSSNFSFNSFCTDSSCKSTESSCGSSNTDSSSSSSSCKSSEFSTDSSVDSSCKNSKSSKDSSSMDNDRHILPCYDGPFTYDRKENVIRYNKERCVDHNAKVVFGNKAWMCDPSNGSSCVGDNQITSKNSYAVGQNNLCELNNSLISGCNNKIKLKVMGNHNKPDKHDKHDKDNNAIVAGCDNELVNTKNCAIIACSGLKLNGAENTAALGIIATPKDKFPENLKETLLVRNLLVAGDLLASNVVQNSLYINGTTSGSTQLISRGDGTDIVYVNPINGAVSVQLGTPKDQTFEDNRVITVKDTTLEFGTTSSHNINVLVPGATGNATAVRIEHYVNGVLTVSNNASYVINTIGGAVTLRYAPALVPGALPTWVIMSKFDGNPRLLHSHGLSFVSADNVTRTKLLTNKL